MVSLMLDVSWSTRNQSQSGWRSRATLFLYLCPRAGSAYAPRRPYFAIKNADAERRLRRRSIGEDKPSEGDSRSALREEGAPRPLRGHPLSTISPRAGRWKRKRSHDFFAYLSCI